MTSVWDIEAIYEALRGGRVPVRGLDLLATGIEAITTELDETLAYATRGNGAIRFLRGEFGGGKTFVARWTQERALQRGFAAAWIVVSETELRLWKPDDLYHGVCESLRTADVDGGALVDVIDRWISRIDDRVAASGAAVGSPEFASRVRDALAVELGAAAGRELPLPMANALRALHAAQEAGDTALASGLVSWLAGSRHVDSAVKRAAGLKGDVGARDATEFLRGLAALLRLAGYAGLVIVIDELETILRTPRASRGRSLNALRQLADMVDQLPGVVWLVTGTPELFDSPSGVAGLPPLHDRIRLLRDGERVSVSQPQIVLPRFDIERLRAVACKVIAHYPARRADFDRDAQHAWVDALIAHLTTAFDGRVDLVPRRFLRELVFRLDLLDEDPTYNPATSLGGAPPLLLDGDESRALHHAAPAMATPTYLEEDVW